MRRKGEGVNKAPVSQNELIECSDHRFDFVYSYLETSILHRGGLRFSRERERDSERGREWGGGGERERERESSKSERRRFRKYKISASAQAKLRVVEMVWARAWARRRRHLPHHPTYQIA